MAVERSQEARTCRLSTSLPPNKLVLVEFSGSEYVNEINTYQVRAAATGLIDPNALLGKPMEIAIVLPNGSQRYVHLLCYSVRYLGRGEYGDLYECELRPWFWLMNFAVKSRIFHEMSVKEILAAVFSDYPDGKYTDKTLGADTILEYTVQYQESDLAFCRRLMEEHGINFHVEMEEDKHTLVMTNDSDSFAKSLAGKVKYDAHDQAQYSETVVLNAWAPQRRVVSRSLRMTDYNFKTPTNNMETEQSLPLGYPGADLEVFEYPGRYDTDSAGRPLNKRRLDGLRTADSLVQADEAHATLGAGTWFELTQHDVDPAQKGKYIVLSVECQFAANSYRSGGAAGEAFRSSYVLTRESNPVAPLLVTPRPRIPGPQTAVVVEGAEGDMDEHGRIMVRFHWDHSARSMPCRVAQMWAGKSWGSVFIPRVGMEVVVEFLDGDPDRPLITGCVYNGDNGTPWSLPGDRAISGIKSQTMGGGGYNEISLNDKSGGEEIVIHAQKDMRTTIEENEYVDVRKDADRKVGGNETEAVQGDSKRDVTGSETLKVNGACTVESMDSITLKVGGNKIVISQSGIVIEALQVEIKASAALKTNGVLVEHKAGGTMTIQAPLININ